MTAASAKLLTALDSDRTTRRELAERALDNPELLHLCERYDILDKIVCTTTRAGSGYGCTSSFPATSADLTTTAGPTPSTAPTTYTPTTASGNSPNSVC